MWTLFAGVKGRCEVNGERGGCGLNGDEPTELPSEIVTAPTKKRRAPRASHLPAGPALHIPYTATPSLPPIHLPSKNFPSHKPPFRFYRSGLPPFQYDPFQRTCHHSIVTASHASAYRSAGRSDANDWRPVILCPAELHGKGNSGLRRCPSGRGALGPGCWKRGRMRGDG